jgi:hypothetical protein
MNINHNITKFCRYDLKLKAIVFEGEDLARTLTYHNIFDHRENPQRGNKFYFDSSREKYQIMYQRMFFFIKIFSNCLSNPMDFDTTPGILRFGAIEFLLGQPTVKNKKF